MEESLEPELPVDPLLVPFVVVAPLPAPERVELRDDPLVPLDMLPFPVLPLLIEPVPMLPLLEPVPLVAGLLPVPLPIVPVLLPLTVPLLLPDGFAVPLFVDPELVPEPGVVDVDDPLPVVEPLLPDCAQAVAAAALTTIAVTIARVRCCFMIPILS